MSENNNWKLEKAKKIASLIYTGIVEDDGSTRDFDILDYYQIINISPKKLYDSTVNSLLDCCSVEEIKSFHSFAIRNFDNKKITIQTIVNMKYMFFINDEIIEVTDEEKLNVIQFLISNKIRLTSTVFSIALKKYIEGNLDLVSNNEKEKVKLL